VVQGGRNRVPDAAEHTAEGESNEHRQSDEGARSGNYQEPDWHLMQLSAIG